jgi:hypothetical protein
MPPMGAHHLVPLTVLTVAGGAVLALSLGAACAPAQGRATLGKEIIVEAGSRARLETVVSFEASGMAPGIYDLQSDAAGPALPLQVDGAGRGWFILPELAAGTQRRFRVAGTRATSGGIQAGRSGDSVSFWWDKQPLLDYVGGQGVLPEGVKPVFRRGGYLHPVRTPSGRVVTDDYPSDHYHHHGIWFAWTKTEFQGRHPDFWNVGDLTGRVDVTALDEAWSGEVHAGVRARHHYTDVSAPTPTIALREEWVTRVFAVGRGRARPYFLFDVDLSQTAATADPLILDEYRYGGIGLRGPKESRDLSNAFFLTSEGKDRKEGDTSRGRWCHIGSRVEGELAGLAILGHPSNFRAPEPMRINPTDPFFCYAPPQLGRFEIRPGTPYTARYRFIVADGGPDPAELDRIWNDYADPPRVTVK